MTENAYTNVDQLADEATWAINSLVEAGQDELVPDLAATYEAELRVLTRRTPRHLRKAS